MGIIRCSCVAGSSVGPLVRHQNAAPRYGHVGDLPWTGSRSLTYSSGRGDRLGRLALVCRASRMCLRVTNTAGGADQLEWAVRLALARVLAAECFGFGPGRIDFACRHGTPRQRMLLRVRRTAAGSDHTTRSPA